MKKQKQRKEKQDYEMLIIFNDFNAKKQSVIKLNMDTAFSFNLENILNEQYTDELRAIPEYTIAGQRINVTGNVDTNHTIIRRLLIKNRFNAGEKV